MVGNKDFINIIREIRGSAAPGEQSTDGIWYELTNADKNGNPGIYGDILAKYGVIAEGSPTLERAVAIIENLNVEVVQLLEGMPMTSELVNGVWVIGIPVGKSGIDGMNGLTPVPTFTYNSETGMLEYEINYVTGSYPAVIEEW